MGTDTKVRVMSGFVWRCAENACFQLIQFVVSLTLARMLTPSDYGMIGLITVFVSVMRVFAQSGLGQALVQRKDADNTDFSTVFYYSIAVSTLLYFILFFASPYIAKFYGQPEIIPVIRVLGISVIICSINGVQQAYIQKKMQFKRFFYSTVIGTIISALIGLYMAYSGYGVWSLVGQTISSQIINTVVLWMMTDWRPVLKFSFTRMKRLLSYGWKLLCSSLLDTVYNNIYTLVIGKFYSSTDLGYYNKGKGFSMLIINNVNSSLNSVLLPVMSEAQNEIERLRAMVRRSIKVSTFVIFPAMAGLAAIAEPLVKVLLTDKWLPAVPFIQFCCFTYAFWPISTANLQAINALGRSDIFLKLEIIKKVISMTVLVITIPYGLMVMMFARCVNALVSSAINAYPNKKLLGYSYIDQVKDVFPIILCSIAMLLCVMPINGLEISEWVKLFIQIPVSVVIYIGLSIIFKVDSFNYIFGVIKKYINRDR